MGIGGISIWQLLIILAIVILLFGTKRLRNLGGDLGTAIKSFRGAMNDKQDETGPDADLDDEEPTSEQVEDRAEAPGKDASATESAERNSRD